MKYFGIIIACIALYILGLGIIFATFAFANVTLDFTLWSQEGRNFCAGLGFAFTLIMAACSIGWIANA